MPIWLRALILGLSLIGYIIVCVYTVKTNYKKCKNSGIIEEELKGIKKNDTALVIILSVIIVVAFVFVCPTWIFLSYYKMLIVMILLFTFTVSLLSNNFKQHQIKLAIISIVIIYIIIIGFFSSNLNNTIVYTETDTVVEIITPSMFSEKKIAYTCDNEGNINKYFYYYQDNGKWKYQEFDESEAEVVEIKNEDTYIKQTTITKECVNSEKKPSAKDYTFEETKVKYNLFINYEQAVEITN